MSLFIFVWLHTLHCTCSVVRAHCSLAIGIHSELAIRMVAISGRPAIVCQLRKSRLSTIWYHPLTPIPRVLLLLRACERLKNTRFPRQSASNAYVIPRNSHFISSRFSFYIFRSQNRREICIFRMFLLLLLHLLLLLLLLNCFHVGINTC